MKKSDSAKDDIQDLLNKIEEREVFITHRAKTTDFQLEYQNLPDNTNNDNDDEKDDDN